MLTQSSQQYSVHSRAACNAIVEFIGTDSEAAQSQLDVAFSAGLLEPAIDLLRSSNTELGQSAASGRTKLNVRDPRVTHNYVQISIVENVVVFNYM